MQGGEAFKTEVGAEGEAKGDVRRGAAARWRKISGVKMPRERSVTSARSVSRLISEARVEAGKSMGWMRGERVGAA